MHLTYWTDGDTRRRGEVLAAVVVHDQDAEGNHAATAIAGGSGYLAVYPLIAVCQMIKRKCGEAAFALRAEREKPQ